MAKIIGIDLGTTNSCVAVLEGGEPKVIANEEGARTTPSIVAFSKSGERLVGQVAKRQAITNPENTIFSIKRFMGRRYNEVNDEMKMVPYKVESQGDNIVVLAQGKPYTLPEISAMILKSSRRLPKPTSAKPSPKPSSPSRPTSTTPSARPPKTPAASPVWTSSASSTSRRRQPSPTASTRRRNETIAVYDFGGGTFDISILEVGEGVIEVKSTNGDTHLGGDNLDQRIVEWLIAEFKAEEGLDLASKGNEMALQRLKDAAEKAKIELSTTMETEINLPFITADATGPKHLVRKLTRAKLEQLVEDLLQRSLEPTKKALADAGIDASQDRRSRPRRRPDPYAQASRRLVKQLFGKEPHRGVNPDEVVAIGAAVQAGVLAGDVKDLLSARRHPSHPSHRDPRRRGHGDDSAQHHHPDQEVRDLLDRGRFNQTEVEVHVLQGERPMASQNRTLGKFKLAGIPPAQRGVPQIEVTFDIDANGILNVTAKDNATGKDQRITITSSSGLSKDEVDRMAKEAEAHAAEDKEQREQIEARNGLDSLAYNIEKMLKEAGDKVQGSERTEVESALADARKLLEGTPSAAELKAEQEKLTTASHKMAEVLYKANSAAASSPDSTGAATGQPPVDAKKDEGVIDAEYVDVEEKKS